MKKIMMNVFLWTIAALGIFILPANLNAGEVIVYIDGEQIEFIDQQPIFMGSGRRTIIPVRAVFEAMGYDVEWHGAERRVTLTRHNDVISLNVAAHTYSASNLVNINGRFMPLGTPVMMFGDRTMIPINGLLERMGHRYQWDNDTRTLRIKSLMGSTSWDFLPGALANQTSPPEAYEQFAVIHTNFGEIHLRLFPDMAPLAVENFVTLAQEGFYDGLVFHRVINDFIIQGGKPLDEETSGESIWGAPFGNETTPNLRHIRGALSMANDGAARPISNRTQFFIVQGDNLYHRFVPELEQALGAQHQLVPGREYTLGELFPSEFDFIRHYLEYGGWPHLDFTHTVFGQVFAGMDVVDAIAAAQTDDADRPLEDVVIQRIEILIFGD